MSIQWSKTNPKTTLASLFDPNVSPGVPKGTLKDVMDKYIEAAEAPKDRVKAWYQVKYELNHFKNILSLPASKVTFGDIKKETNRMISYPTLLNVYTFAMTGYHRFNSYKKTKIEQPEISLNGHSEKPIKLEIQTASIDTLKDLLTTRKLSELQVEILQSIKTCPEGQYRIIPFSKDMIESKKARQSFAYMMNRTLAEQYPTWCSRTILPNKIFILAPKSLVIEHMKTKKKEKVK
jgi:hypothetical protein